MKPGRFIFAFLLVVFFFACELEEQLPLPEREETLSPTVVERPSSVWNGKIKVASIFPTQGRYSISGRQSHKGAEMAVEEINALGGVHGRELEMLRYGTGSYYIDAGYAAELAVQDGAVAIVGTNSSDLSLEMARIAQEYGILMVTNISTAPHLTWDMVESNYDFVFRVCHSDKYAGVQLALFAQDILDAKRVAVLYEVGRTYSLNLARSFISAFHLPTMGFEAKEFIYLKMEVNFQPQLEQIRRFKPDVIFVPGSAMDATLIAMQAESLNIDAILLGGDSWSNTPLFKRGGSSRLAFFYDHWFPVEPFKSMYEERHGEIPHGGRAVLAFDAVLALKEALEALGPLDDEAIREGVNETRVRLMESLRTVDFSGLSGPISFDGHGDRKKGGVFVKVEKGKRTRYPWAE